MRVKTHTVHRRPDCTACRSNIPTYVPNSWRPTWDTVVAVGTVSEAVIDLRPHFEPLESHTTPDPAWQKQDYNAYEGTVAFHDTITGIEAHTQKNTRRISQPIHPSKARKKTKQLYKITRIPKQS